MKRTIADKATGICLNITSKLDDLDYADNIALLSSAREQMQAKVDRLVKHTRSTSFNISASKTKVMRINANNNQAIRAAGEETEDVNNFMYLRGIVNTKRGTSEDFRRRLGHSRMNCF